VTPELGQYFGSGGSGTTTTPATPATVTVTTTWQRFEVVFEVPSISGKTLGTGTPYTEFRLVFPDSVTFTVDLAGPQAEFGDQASPFFLPQWSIDLAGCLSYFQKSYDLDVAPGTATNAGMIQAHENGGVKVQGTSGTFAAAMRTKPAVTIYSPSTGTAGKADASGAPQDAQWTNISNVSHGAVQFNQDPTTSIVEAHYAASAEI
jgi:hypothetical protein